MRFDIAPYPRAKTPADISAFGREEAGRALAFHRALPEYAPTPLVRLDALAVHLGVRRLLVKDESCRFGLNAFKALGGSYAMRAAAEGKRGPLAFATATDGNHGRGVAWAAARLGHEAHVFMPKGTAKERLLNIRRLGAHAEITDMPYDDTVRYAARLARENGWILLQDTAWDGYEDVPRTIMQGYLTMGAEIEAQLGTERPTHVFLQAGVGSMAAAIAAYFANVYGADRPTVVTVEPNAADCLYRSAKAGDGKARFCEGEMRSIMAGLCCGEPCTLAWAILRDWADFAVSCPDYVSADGMRVLGCPLEGDARVVSGESGAVTAGLIFELTTRPALAPLRERIGLNADSVALCISTEGDTDRANYRDVVWRGRYPAPVE